MIQDVFQLKNKIIIYQCREYFNQIENNFVSPYSLAGSALD